MNQRGETPCHTIQRHKRRYFATFTTQIQLIKTESTNKRYTDQRFLHRFRQEAVSRSL